MQHRWRWTAHRSSAPETPQVRKNSRHAEACPAVHKELSVSCPGNLDSNRTLKSNFTAHPITFSVSLLQLLVSLFAPLPVKIISQFGFRLNQPCLLARGRLESQLLVARLRGHTPLRRAVEVALHDEVRLIDFLEGVRFLTNGDGERTDADRAAAKLHDDGFEDALIHLVEAILVDLEDGERLIGDGAGDAALMADLRIVAHAAEEVVGDARRAPAT